MTPDLPLRQGVMPLFYVKSPPVYYHRCRRNINSAFLTPKSTPQYLSSRSFDDICFPDIHLLVLSHIRPPFSIGDIFYFIPTNATFIYNVNTVSFIYGGQEFLSVD